MLTLADVLEVLCGARPAGSELAISATVIDSRLAITGSMFVALPGEQVDGHNYLEDAFKHGARLALIHQDISVPAPVLDLRKSIGTQKLDEAVSDILQQAHFCLRVENSLQAMQQVARFWRRKHDLRVIGITGSVGKSTTKEVIAQVLSRRYRTLKNAGNLNNEIGLPLTLLELNESHQRAVLEMGFYVPGEIAFLCDLALPQVGVITNIGTVHAERAGSLEAIASGKAELVEALPPAPEGVAILNYDDFRVREMAAKTRARIFFYGLDSQADIWADNIEGLGLDGIRFRLHYKKETLHLKVPLIGRHSVHTVLRAAAVGLIEGLTWQEIMNGLRSEHTQLRLMAVPAKNGSLLLDDTYNASPESTLAALNLLEELQGHKIAVLGDMLELGPYEQEGHEMVGLRAAKVVNELVTVGKLAHKIAEAAIEAGLPVNAVTELDDNQQAIEHLSRTLRARDVVLVKGSRGMHMDQIVAGLEARK
jgi:UDP-N-acetylmuramoyl-tripeptide--D-alanyl-D-alanine ligase